MLCRVKSKSSLTIAGATAAGLLVTAGIATLVLGGGGSAGDAARVAESTKAAKSHTSTTQIAKALKARGATGCTGDAQRTECRFEGQYVAATVLAPGSSLPMDTALQSWKSGLGQSMLNDQSPFAVLHGPNWLVTGPQGLVTDVRSQLGGTLIRCERPFGDCR
jgi:hypothetical protein